MHKIKNFINIMHIHLLFCNFHAFVKLVVSSTLLLLYSAFSSFFTFSFDIATVFYFKQYTFFSWQSVFGEICVAVSDLFLDIVNTEIFRMAFPHLEVGCSLT